MKNLVITLDFGMMWIAKTKMNLFVKKYEIHLVHTVGFDYNYCHFTNN